MDTHQLATVIGAACGLLGLIIAGAVRYVRLAIRSELGEFMLQIGERYCEPKCDILIDRIDGIRSKLDAHIASGGHQTALAEIGALSHRVDVLEQWKERF